MSSISIPAVISSGTNVTPFQVSNLSAWWDGNDPAGNGIKPLDGTLISNWVDKSGNGNNATQSNPVRQVPFSSNGFSTGKGTLLFDVNDSLLTVPSNSTINLSTGNFTLFSVHKPMAVGDVWHWFYEKGDGTNTSLDYSFGIDITGKMRLSIGNNFKDDLFGSTNISTGVAYIHSDVFNLSGTNNKMYQGNSTINNTSIIAGDINSNDLYIGNKLGQMQGYVGYIAEMLIYKKALSDSERETIMRYLSQKWGVPL